MKVEKAELAVTVDDLDVVLDSVTVTLTVQELAVVGMALGNLNAPDLAKLANQQRDERRQALLNQDVTYARLHAVYQPINNILNRFYDEGIYDREVWEE